MTAYYIVPCHQIKKEDKDIDWRKSEARDIILSNLMDEMLPLDEDVCPACQAWEQMAGLQHVLSLKDSCNHTKNKVDNKFIYTQQQWVAKLELLSYGEHLC